MVIFDHKEVIAVSPHNLLANLTLTEDSVSGDDPSFQHQRAQQFQGCFGLVGVGGDLLLAQDEPVC